MGAVVVTLCVDRQGGRKGHKGHERSHVWKAQASVSPDLYWSSAGGGGSLWGGCREAGGSGAGRCARCGERRMGAWSPGPRRASAFSVLREEGSEATCWELGAWWGHRLEQRAGGQSERKVPPALPGGGVPAPPPQSPGSRAATSPSPTSQVFFQVQEILQCDRNLMNS